MNRSSTATPRNIADALRGERERRPPADVSSASGLRSILEDGIYEILGGARPISSLVIRASSLRQMGTISDISLAPLSRVRGILVNQVLRLLSIGANVNDPFNDALRAWRLEVRQSDLLDLVDHLDADERARLETDVTAHAVTLTRSLGSVRASWRPRSTVRASQYLGAGAVILRDVIDLMVGTTSSELANVALFDLTTSPLGEGAERTMRYHALVQTLRTSVVPLRTTCFSSATGEMWSLDVDSETLVRSANEVLAAIERLWREQ